METSVPLMVVGIKVSKRIVPATLVKTVGSINLARTSVIILFYVQTSKAKYLNFRNLHYLL